MIIYRPYQLEITSEVMFSKFQYANLKLLDFLVFQPFNIDDRRVFREILENMWKGDSQKIPVVHLDEYMIFFLPCSESLENLPVEILSRESGSGKSDFFYAFLLRKSDEVGRKLSDTPVTPISPFKNNEVISEPFVERENPHQQDIIRQTGNIPMNIPLPPSIMNNPMGISHHNMSNPNQNPGTLESPISPISGEPMPGIPLHGLPMHGFHPQFPNPQMIGPNGQLNPQFPQFPPPFWANAPLPGSIPNPNSGEVGNPGNPQNVPILGHHPFNPLLPPNAMFPPPFLHGGTTPSPIFPPSPLFPGGTLPQQNQINLQNQQNQISLQNQQNQINLQNQQNQENQQNNQNQRANVKPIGNHSSQNRSIKTRVNPVPRRDSNSVFNRRRPDVNPQHGRTIGSNKGSSGNVLIRPPEPLHPPPRYSERTGMKRDRNMVDSNIGNDSKRRKRNDDVRGGPWSCGGVGSQGNTGGNDKNLANFGNSRQKANRTVYKQQDIRNRVFSKPSNETYFRRSPVPERRDDWRKNHNHNHNHDRISSNMNSAMNQNSNSSNGINKTGFRQMGRRFNNNNNNNNSNNNNNNVNNNDGGRRDNFSDNGNNNFRNNRRFNNDKFRRNNFRNNQGNFRNQKHRR